MYGAGSLQPAEERRLIRFMWHSGVVVAVLIFGACGAGVPASENTAPNAGSETVADAGFFTESQANRGRQTFGLVCSECHDTSDFRGDDFEWEWRRRSVWDFYRRLRETMPEDRPGSLSPTTYADVISYILQLNDYVSGRTELSPSEESMDSIQLGPGVDKSGRRASSGNDSR